MQKLIKISKRSASSTQNKSTSLPKQIRISSNNSNKAKKFEDEKIKKENQRIIEKIIFKTSDLNKNKFLNDYEKHLQYKKNILKMPEIEKNSPSNQNQLTYIMRKKSIYKK